jgi:Ca2+-binding RTX toxin-like protein
VFAGFLGDDTFVGHSTNVDKLIYQKDESFAGDYLDTTGQTLVLDGITVNFSADIIAGDGATGTIVDSFGDTDTVSHVDIVRGTNFIDTFNGGVDGETFIGNKGDDILNGGGGHDVASYESDQDHSDGQSGINANFSTDVTANGISIGTVIDGYGNTDQLNGIEQIDGTDFVDVFVGGADAVRFYGNRGNDVIRGGSGSDILAGGKDNDTIYGDPLSGLPNAAIDRALFSGQRSNYTVSLMIDGGFLVVDKRADGSGSDKIYGIEQFDFAGQVFNFTDVLNFKADPIVRVGTKKADNLTGDSGDDTLTGLAGHDKIFGLDGDDTLILGDGNDQGEGGGSDDEIFGGKGNDIANGGNGDDLLDLGAGNDTGNGGDNEDHIIAGKGNDIANGGSGDDLLDLGDGNDTGNGGDGSIKSLVEKATT